MTSVHKKYAKDIHSLCRQHGVVSLYIFGSALTDRFDAESDIDLLVTFDHNSVPDSFDNYFNLKYALESLFGREIDLVEDKTVRNPYLRANIDSSKQLVYGKAN